MSVVVLNYNGLRVGPGRRPTVMLAPELTAEQRRAVKVFELERWFPTLLSCMTARPLQS